jgi:hypothetical protein
MLLFRGHGTLNRGRTVVVMPDSIQLYISTFEKLRGTFETAGLFTQQLLEWPVAA